MLDADSDTKLCSFEKPQVKAAVLRYTVAIGISLFVHLSSPGTKKLYQIYLKYLFSTSFCKYLLLKVIYLQKLYSLLKSLIGK